MSGSLFLKVSSSAFLRQYDVISLVRRVCNRGQNILAFEVGIVVQNFLVGSACAQELQNIRHSHPHSTNARASATFAGFNGDAFEKFCVHVENLVKLWEADKRVVYESTVHFCHRLAQLAVGEIAFHLLIPRIDLPAMQTTRDFRPFIQRQFGNWQL